MFFPVNIREHIQGLWTQHSPQQLHKIIVAASGGLDSCVLLHSVAAVFPKMQIIAVHINHQLSDNANVWQQHVELICQQYNIECKVSKVSFSSAANLEEQARSARYACFAQLMDPNTALLLAHHQHDQAETVLYRLVRGSGPEGLAGMPEVRPFKQGLLMRPLLGATVQQIRDYAQYHQLKWLEDESNQLDRFDRNYLRNQILPMLEQRWPHALDSINRCAKHLHQHNVFVDEIIKEQLSQRITAEGQLKLTGLSENPQADLLIRGWLKTLTIPMLSTQQLQCLQREVIDAREDAQPFLKVGQYYFRRYRHLLYAEPNATLPEKTRAQWQLSESLSFDTKKLIAMPCVGQGINAQLVQPTVDVRNFAFGEKAKKIFQQFAIPPWRRQQYHAIYSQQRLLAIVGLWVNPRCIATGLQSGYLVEELPVASHVEIV